MTHNKISNWRISRKLIRENWNIFLKSLFLAAFALSSCTVAAANTPVGDQLTIAAAEEAAASASIFRIQGDPQPIQVPFTDFNTPSYKIDLYFDPYSQYGEFHLNDGETVKIPSGEIPLKVLELGNEEFFVFTRDLNTSRVMSWKLSLPSDWIEITLPETLAPFLFRQAFTYQDWVGVILYDVIEAKNVLYQIVSTEKGMQFLEDSRFEIPVTALYPHQPHILVEQDGNSTILAAGSSVLKLRYDDKGFRLDRYELTPKFRILEMTVSPQGVMVLCKNLEYDISTDVSDLYVIFDVYTGAEVEIDFQNRVPYDLRIDHGSPEVSYVETEEDLARLFVFDLTNMNSSGIMSAGMTNLEGEVVWSQSYYLQGFIDLLYRGLNEGHNEALAELREEIKTRLNFEMILLDHLLKEGKGLNCRAFTVDRSEAVHAVQSGKILLLLKRYLQLPNPVPLTGYESFKQHVIKLEGHIESLQISDGTVDPLESGRYYLTWPKGVPFWADGSGIPYNHQNCWAAGILYAEDIDQLDDETAQAALDIAHQVLDFEGFRDLIPKHSLLRSGRSDRYLWFYWWGIGKDGWSAADGISINTLDWRGDGDNIARPVYRTFDAIAILIGSQVSHDMKPDLLNYFNEAVEEDGLDLFLIPYLELYEKTPQIDQNLAMKYLRVDEQPDFRNAMWAYKGMTVFLNKSSQP